MEKAILAVYENGVFRVLSKASANLIEGQQIRITVDDPGEHELIRLAARVFDGLTSQQIDEVERAALDRGYRTAAETETANLLNRFA